MPSSCITGFTSASVSTSAAQQSLRDAHCGLSALPRTRHQAHEPLHAARCYVAPEVARNELLALAVQHVDCADGAHWGRQRRVAAASEHSRAQAGTNWPPVQV